MLHIAVNCYALFLAYPSASCMCIQQHRARLALPSFINVHFFLNLFSRICSVRNSRSLKRIIVLCAVGHDRKNSFGFIFARGRREKDPRTGIERKVFPDCDKSTDEQ